MCRYLRAACRHRCSKYGNFQHTELYRVPGCEDTWSRFGLQGGIVRLLLSTLQVLLYLIAPQSACPLTLQSILRFAEGGVGVGRNGVGPRVGLLGYGNSRGVLKAETHTAESRPCRGCTRSLLSGAQKPWPCQGACTCRQRCPCSSRARAGASQASMGASHC